MNEHAPKAHEVAERIWEILVEHVGVDPEGSWHDMFLYWFESGQGREFRFGANLGFGGKFWRNDGRWYVTHYPEDADIWPEMPAIADAANEALAELKDELAESWKEEVE